ncbi:hypothetical protein DW736_11230 [Coprobacillus sp. AM28-15LB]|jgi:hypothetical protein|nr:hypothetical protein DW736_11230 [Coprobacillus sp. AM28-15LB]
MGNIQKKDGFIFYKSFYDSINALDESMQLEVYKALAEYGLTGEMRDDLSPITKALLTAMIPTIDNANKRYVASVENGKKGGRPKKNKEVVQEIKENLEEPSHNLEKPKQNLKEPNPNPYVSVSVSVSDTDTLIKDKKIKEKDKTEEQAPRLNYITECLLKKDLILEDEVSFVDDLVNTYQQSFNGIDINCKCEYILKKMKTKHLKNRMNYFKSAFEKNIYQDFQKESNYVEPVEKIPIDDEALSMLEKYD